MERGLVGMKSIKQIFNDIISLFCDFDIATNHLPYWMQPIQQPQPMLQATFSLYKDVPFMITENVCGLTINYGYIRRGIFTRFVAYDKNSNLIRQNSILTPKIRRALADIRTLL